MAVANRRSFAIASGSPRTRPRTSSNTASIFEHRFDQCGIDGHDHAARHGEGLGPAHAHGECRAPRSRALQVLDHKPKAFSYWTSPCEVALPPFAWIRRQAV